MITLRLYGLEGYVLHRFEDEPEPESFLWRPLGCWPVTDEKLAAFLAKLELQNEGVLRRAAARRPLE